MPLDPSSYTSGQHLTQRLEAHNPWWGFDGEFDPAGGVDARRRAFRDAVETLTADDQRLLVVGAVAGTERAGLLEQLVGTVLDQEYQERYIQDPALRAAASELIVPPENVLFVPLGASPLFQIHPAQALRAAVDHFQTHVATSGTRQFVFLDGIDAIRRPGRRGSEDGSAWLDALATVAPEAGNVTAVVSGPSATFLGDRLTGYPEFGVHTDQWTVQSVDQLGFEEYLRCRFRRLDVAPLDERFDPQSARQAFRTAVHTGDVATFAAAVRAADGGRLLAPSTLRRALTTYAVAGGRLTATLDRAGVDLSGDRFERLLRDRGDRPLGSFQADVVEELEDEVTRVAARLYGLRDAPGPSRLAAVLAADRPTEPVRFDDLCAVLDVDRRTLREQYLRVLGELGLVGGGAAYANRRPRSITLFHRDPSVPAAFGEFDLRDTLRQKPGLAPELWSVMAYDHTVRLSDAVNDPHDPKRGVVKHWAAAGGVVDFVLKVDGRPVPVVFSPGETLTELDHGSGADAHEALVSFLRRTDELDDEDSLTTRHYAAVPESVVEQRRAVVDDEGYFGTRRGDAVVDGSAPFGIVVTNARGATDAGVVVDRSAPAPILQLPLWTYLRLA